MEGAWAIAGTNRKGAFEVNNRGTLVLMAGVLSLVMVLSTPLMASAQTNEGGSGTAIKIGVVNRKEVFDKYEKQIAEFKKLDADKAAKQSQIDQIEQKITKAQDQLKDEKKPLSAEDRAKLEQQVKADMLQYKQEFEKLQSDLDDRWARAIRGFREEIDAAVQVVAAEKNYHLVLECDPKSPTTGVVYFATGIDITQAVIEKLNSGK